MIKLKKGQIVYIMGRYRARVVAILPDGHISCWVCEGLPKGEKKMYLTFHPMFIKKEKYTPLTRKKIYANV